MARASKMILKVPRYDSSGVLLSKAVISHEESFLCLGSAFRDNIWVSFIQFAMTEYGAQALPDTVSVSVTGRQREMIHGESTCVTYELSVIEDEFITSHFF